MTFPVPPLILRAVQVALAAVVFGALFGSASEEAPPREGDVVAFVERGTESERWVVVGRTDDGSYLLERIEGVVGTPVIADPGEVVAADP